MKYTGTNIKTLRYDKNNTKIEPINKDLKKFINTLLFLIYNFRNGIKWSLVDATIPELQKDLKNVTKHMNYFEIRYLVELEKKYQKPSMKNSWAYQEFIKIPEITNPEDIPKITEKIIKIIYEKKKEILKKIGKRARLTTISIGIAPRQMEKGTSKSATAWIYIPIDFDVDEWKSKEPTMEEINTKINEILSELPDDYTKPHLIVFTGGGLRFIYYIDRPISRLELPILSKIAEHIGHGADTAMYDIARVDRLPGTKNRKEKYGKERDCKIIHIKEDLKPIAPEVFYSKFGISDEEYKQTIKKANEKTITFETVNKLKKTSIKVKNFKELTEKEYKFTHFLQAKLTEKCKNIHKLSKKEEEKHSNSQWIIELLEYLGIGYKTTGNRIQIYSIYYEDGNNPDCTIYPNKGYNAIAVDWHNNNLRTNVIAYLWGAYKEKILEFVEKKGISSKVDDYVEVEEYLDELLNKNGNITVVECKKYLTYEVLQKAINLSVEKKEPVILQAETGRGKTYTITNNIEKLYKENDGKITILLSPYKSQVKQIESQLKQNGIKVAAYYEKSQTRIPNAKETRIVVGTYNQLDNIMNDIKYDEIEINGEIKEIQIRDDKDIILIIDEAHNMILQKEFRPKEINKIEHYADKTYATIYLTATPELINLQNKQVVKAVFKDKKEYFQNTIIVESESSTHNLINFCKYITMKFNKGCKKAIALVDSKKNMELIEELLKIYNFGSEIYKITKETLETDKAGQMIIQEEKMPDGLILTTRIMAEGVNIKNGEGENETIQMNIKDKVDVVAVLKTSSATIIRQFLARVRNGGDTCIIYSENKKPTPMLRYEKLLEKAEEDYTLFREYLVSEYNEELLDIDLKLKYTGVIEQTQLLKRTDDGFDVDKSKIAHLTNKKLERVIVSNSKLIKKYLDTTTEHEWKIIQGEEVLEEEVENIKELKKILKRLNNQEVKKLEDIVYKKKKEVTNAVIYNNYDSFSDSEKYIILKHNKMTKRLVEYLKWHEENPEITKIIFGKEIKDEKEIITRVSELSSAKWGAVRKRIGVAYNIAKGVKHELMKYSKTYLKGLETKVVLKIYNKRKELINKTITIMQIIKEVMKECGIRLKFREIKRILSTIYNYISDEMNEKRENAKITIKGMDEMLKQLIDIFLQKEEENTEEEKREDKEEKTIEEEILEKAEGGVSEIELWEYVVEVLKYPEEIYEKTLEKLKRIGELIEPRQGYFVRE